MKSNQKGFSVVELSVIIVVVVLLGAVGWLFYDRQKNKSDKQPIAQSSQQTEETTNSTDITVQSSVHYFEIKEFGVKFEQPQSLKGLYYHLGNNGRTAYFSLEELKGTDCAADKTAQIALSRYTDSDYSEDVQAAASKDTAKKIGNFYFNTASGHAMCSDDAAVQNKASDMRAEIAKILPSSLAPIQ